MSWIDWISVVICFGYGIHGIFHQLVVGGVFSVFTGINEKQSKLLLMTWISTGAFISSMGFLPGILILLFGVHDPVVLASLIVLLFSILLFIIHNLMAGIRFLPRPIKVGFSFSIIYFIYLSSLTTAVFFGFI